MTRPDPASRSHAGPTRTQLWSRLLPAAVLFLSLSGAAPFAEGLDAIVGENSSSTLRTDLGKVYSLLDYFESGRRAVQVYVANAPRRITEPRLGRIIDSAAQACVRVEIRFGREAAGYQSVSGSGVLIDRGKRVLTAGHTLEDLMGQEVIVTLPTGATRRARVSGQDYAPLGEAGNDWAILEILGGGFRDIPEVEFGEAEAGDLAIMLGYPDQIGINAAGRVAFPTGEDGEQLYPLVTLGTVEREDEITLLPRAGAIPTGGMSGGPVFDARGRLLGIFVSIVRADELGASSYAFRATPVRSVRRHLKH